MDRDLLELLCAFNAHNVEYLVIGGYAVGLHAEPRATKDLDVWIRSDKNNSELVFRALAEFGAPLENLGPEDFNDEVSVFQIGSPPLRIDVLQRIDGLSFEEAWPRRIEAPIHDGLLVHVISKEDLIRNKLASGRSRDLLDVEALRESELLD